MVIHLSAATSKGHRYDVSINNETMKVGVKSDFAHPSSNGSLWLGCHGVGVESQNGISQLAFLESECVLSSEYAIQTTLHQRHQQLPASTKKKHCRLRLSLLFSPVPLIIP